MNSIEVTCLNCSKTFLKKNYQVLSSPNHFCCQSCAATYNNKKFPKRKIEKKKCKKCEKPRLGSAAYCSKECYLKDKSDEMTLKFLNGLVYSRPTLRKYLQSYYGNHCSICKNLPLWEGKALTLIVDHIDGDCTNNYPDNLRLLCPNCNSQTSTFCGRNKGFGRESRGIKRGGLRKI